MNPFSTGIYKIDAHIILRFYSRRWCARLFPYFAVWIVVFGAACLIDIRYALALAMLSAVSLPMLWILAVDRLFGIARTLAAPTSVNLDDEGRLSVVTYRRNEDDDAYAVISRRTLAKEEYSLSSDSGYIYVRFPDGGIIIPESSMNLD